MRKSKLTKSPAVQEEGRGRLAKVVAEQDGKVRYFNLIFLMSLPALAIYTRVCLAWSRKSTMSEPTMESLEGTDNMDPRLKHIGPVARTWENVVEGADGTLTSTVEELAEAVKRKR